MFTRLCSGRGQGMAGRNSYSFDLENLEPRIQFSGGAGTIPAGHWKLPDLHPLASRGKQYVYGWTLDQDQEPGHTLLRLTTAMANSGPGRMEIFTKGPKNPDGSRNVFQRIYGTGGKTFARPAGTLRWHAAHHHYHFDNFAVYRLRTVTASGGVGKIVASGDKASFCLTDVDPYNQKLHGAPKESFYDSCSYKQQGISVGWADVYTESLDGQWIDVTNLPAGKYWLEVVVDPNNRIVESNEKNNTIRIPIHYAPPPPPPPPAANDNFSDRAILEGASATDAGTTLGATVEPDEPDIGNIAGGSSLWWSWTAATDGKVTVSSKGSDFDTMLGVYTGDTLAQLVEVAHNDDGPQKQTSVLTFNAQAGITYEIVLDGYHGAAGSFKLSLSEA